jgi:hypothetical protein
MLENVSYIHLPKGEILYRGNSRDDKRSEINLPFMRGVYVSDDIHTACLYADKESSFKVDKYITKFDMNILLLTWKNVDLLIKEISKIKNNLVLRNGCIITPKKTIEIIKKYSSFTQNGKNPLEINTGSGNYITINTTKSLKCTDYLGHWFSHIICYFGFNGYRVQKIYYRKNSNYLFHPEFYLCNPILQIKKISNTTKCSDHIIPKLK